MLSVLEDFPSIYDLAPIEQGGPTARTGFLYQDHIAAGFCIEMLRNPKLSEVWCETLDDITLLRSEDGNLTIEFVQVKASELSQMWSIALICSGGAKSIIARSLAQHRCCEPCHFRIVTRVGVQAELQVLRRGHDSHERCLGNEATRLLHQTIGKQLDSLCSPAGWSVSNWLQHTYWDVAESEAAVAHSNLLVLEGWLEDDGEPLFSDQREELYNRILARVVKASALAHHFAKQKKFLRAQYREWVLSEVNRIKGRLPTKAGKNLTGKMKNAQIPDSAIQNALDLRLAYRRRMLDPTYQHEGDYKIAELELTAVLQHLVAQLDAGLVKTSGPAFHAHCLNAVADVRQRFSHVDLSFLHGSMYSMTDRCRHRFLPAALP
jgi:hypothetical protein